MKGTKNMIYLALALAMLIYAVPQLEIGQGLTAPTIFSIAWICFALMIIAAHLHELLGVDEEQRRELAKIKRMKAWQLEQAVQGRRRMLQFRKSK